MVLFASGGCPGMSGHKPAGLQVVRPHWHFHPSISRPMRVGTPEPLTVLLPTPAVGQLLWASRLPGRETGPQTLSLPLGRPRACDCGAAQPRSRHLCLPEVPLQSLRFPSPCLRTRALFRSLPRLWPPPLSLAGGVCVTAAPYVSLHHSGSGLRLCSCLRDYFHVSPSLLLWFPLTLRPFLCLPQLPAESLPPHFFQVFTPVPPLHSSDLGLSLATTAVTPFNWVCWPPWPPGLRAPCKQGPCPVSSGLSTGLDN